MKQYARILLGAAALSLSVPALAEAQATRSVRSILVGEADGTGVMSYMTADNSARFVLDIGLNDALLQFEGAAEIYALEAESGAGGDILYVNDVGRTMARINARDAVTLYTAEAPEGVAAYELAEAVSLRLPPIGRNRTVDASLTAGALGAEDADVLADVGALPRGAAPETDEMERALDTLRARLNDAADRDVVVAVPAPRDDRDRTIYADAAWIAAAAFAGLAEDPVAETAFARIQGVSFVRAGGADVDVEDDVVFIGVDTAQGYAGRPSSERIARDVRRAYQAG